MTTPITKLETASDAAQFCYKDTHLQISQTEHLAIVDSRRVTLRHKEHALLVILTSHAGIVVPRAALLMKVWGYGPGIRTRTLDVHILRLRKHLGQYGKDQIETVQRIGYRFSSAKILQD